MNQTNKSFIVAAGCAVLLFSCKEQPVQISSGGTLAEDTTYVASPEAPQEKMFLLEEFTGVQCPNCPEGAEELETLNTQNGNTFIIVGLHTGSLTNPIPGKSIQNFQTEDGKLVRELIFGEQGNKPTVSFDRLKLGNNSNTYLVDGSVNWAQAISQMKAFASTTPVNVALSSTFDEAEQEYNIEVKVSFTGAVAEPLALSVFLTENKIMEAFTHSETFIEYNHVLRDALTEATGRNFLSDLPEKEAGRVYIYRTSFKIDATDEQQQYWKPENMDVIAFVSKADPEDKHVLQVSKIPLQ